MPILKKVFLVVLFLAVITGLKHLLDRYSPTSIVFHYNFLTCLQYIVLIGVLLWAILQSISYLVSKKRLKAKWFWVIFLGILTCTEVFFYYSLRNPEKVNDSFHDLLTEYYMTYEINFPNLTYDSVLSYTLQKNSVYEHDNIEFSNEIRVNSAGFRDDNESLVRPAVICLGDSYTMGWGVPADKSFPQLVENRTGLKVLNTGITSYGTARELLLLNKLDTSNLQYLIIQYCYNDFTENKAFLQNGRYLPVGSQTSQAQTHKSYQLARTYFPFKYSLTIFRMYVRNKLLSWTNQSGKDPNLWTRSNDYVVPSVETFLQILYKSNINFAKWKVIVIDTNRYPAWDHHFLEIVEKTLNEGDFSEEFKRNLHLLKIAELNDQRYFYPLDNHLNEAGHTLVADKILSNYFNKP